jgi:hypothetical protein
MSRVPLVLTLLLVLVTAGACAGGAPSAPSPVEPVETNAAGAPAAPPLVEVLRAWDARRAEAWARGDPGLLAKLYTPRSVAGRRDRAMLRAWVTRGLVVRELRTQLVAVRELRRTRSTWTLQVTDRLAGGVAVGRGVRRPLPVDEATTRIIELRRMGGQWRVAAVSTAGFG